MFIEPFYVLGSVQILTLLQGGCYHVLIFHLRPSKVKKLVWDCTAREWSWDSNPGRLVSECILLTTRLHCLSACSGLRSGYQCPCPSPTLYYPWGPKFVFSVPILIFVAALWGRHCYIQFNNGQNKAKKVVSCQKFPAGRSDLMVLKYFTMG